MKTNKTNRPLTSTEKSRKRVRVMDTIATKVTGEKITWRKLETRIRKAFMGGAVIELRIVLPE